MNDLDAMDRAEIEAGVEALARVAALEARVAALSRALCTINEAAGLDSPTEMAEAGGAGYEAAVAVQQRRAQMHVVRAGGGQ